VNIKVKPHPFFKRHGNDVTVELQINMAEAALGTTAAVPTLSGEDHKLTIPPGTQSGAVFRLRRMGVPAVRGNGRGDQLVVVQVAIPEKLSSEQRELLERLSETLGGAAVIEEKQGFVDRVKEALGL
jgi:molecular chaperone DnaJ